MNAPSWSQGERPPRRRSWMRSTLGFIWRHLNGLVLFILLVAFAILVILPHVIINVPSGQVGVLWKRFGGGTALDPAQLKDEGLNFMLPWDRIYFYNLRIQAVSETYNAISSDGVNMSATINVRFRLRREFIPQLHQSIGPDYLGLLGPEVASRMREVFSMYTAEQIYSTDRQKIQDEIRNRVIEKLGERFLERDGLYRIPIRDVGILYDTLLHEIRLPPEVVGAINRKAEQYYVSQEYIYRVEREKRESARKIIEAQGISEFQRIVSQGISDSYLRWRGIEATLELSKSNNAKIVIIGGNKDGLPIILGNVDGAALPAAPTQQAPAPVPAPAPAPTPGAGDGPPPLPGAGASPADKMPRLDASSAPRSNP